MRDGTAQLLGIGLCLAAGIAPEIKGDSRLEDPLLTLAHDVGDKRHQIDRLLGQRHQPGFALRQVEHVFDLLGQLGHRLRDRLDIIARLWLKITCYPGHQQFGKTADRRQRSAEFVGHISEEAGHHRIGFFQRTVTFPERFFSLTRCGHVEHDQQPIAIGQWHAGIIERPAIGEFGSAFTLAPVERRRANNLADRFDLRTVGKLFCDGLEQGFSLWMSVDLFRLQPPDGREAAVPKLEIAIGRDHGERLEQIVESRGTRSQQSVAHGGYGKLFGAILRDHHQPAIGQWLRDDPQML